ncbi:MAG: hypothetical protein IKO47_00395 [Ruminococcus sp.]|nr:hypothetical protein [Ruminococcus sp.]
MKTNKLIALLLAAAMPLSLLSCSDTDSYDSDSRAETSSASSTESVTGKSKSDIDIDSLSISYTPFDLDDYRPHVIQMLEDIKQPGNRDKVAEDIETILQDWKLMSDANTRIGLNYYLDFHNEDLEAEYDKTSEDIYIFSYLMYLAFTRCSEKDEYKDLAEKYVTDDILDTFSSASMTPKRVEGYAKVDYELSDERLDEYYDIYDDDDMDEDEKELKCAEIYLDILSEYDYDEFYEKYGRDFSPEHARELADVVIDELLPAYKYLSTSFAKMDGAYDLYYSPPEFNDPFGIIRKYAPSLSSDISEYADKIVDDELFCVANDEDAYPGSFTTSLHLTDDSFIFINDPKGERTLSTAIHEFGHFYSAYKSGVEPFNGAFCVDVAEIQSQGFEFLFMQFYDKIYGDLAEPMKVYTTMDMLDSIAGGFIVGKFESVILERRDELTPQDVVDIWHDIADDEVNYSFYYFNHIFENPGYYISYGTSALAAFDIWKDCLTAPDKALKKYEKIAKISPYSHDTYFCDTLDKCGFSDVLTKTYVKNLAKDIRKYADNLE